MCHKMAQIGGTWHSQVKLLPNTVSNLKKDFIHGYYD